MTTLTPRRFRDYQQCTLRFFWTHIGHKSKPFTFHHHLAIGQVTHNVLHHVCVARRDGGAVPDLESVVHQRVITAGYPEELHEQRGFDELRIAEGVLWAMDQISPTAEVVGVEQVVAVPFKQVRLEARLDLLLRHDDVNVEHIEYKTGRAENRDLVQETICSQGARLATAATEEETVVTTVLKIDQREAMHVPIDPVVTSQLWATIDEVVTDLQDRTVWEPNPTPECYWCPYRDACPPGAEASMRV